MCDGHSHKLGGFWREKCIHCGVNANTAFIQEVQRAAESDDESRAL
jgi:hypothetical protein